MPLARVLLLLEKAIPGSCPASQKELPKANGLVTLEEEDADCEDTVCFWCGSLRVGAERFWQAWVCLQRPRHVRYIGRSLCLQSFDAVHV